MRYNMTVNNKDKKRLVLLDAHAILHRAYHALPEFSTSKGQPTGALYGLSSMVIKIIEDLHPDYIVACYDVKGPTYRHEAYKDYKAGRPKTEEDLISQINKSREIFSALNVPIYDKQGYEADDILGTIVEKSRKQKAESEIVIASGDMDTLQLVHGKDVQVYTLKKGINDTIVYDENVVKKRFGFGPELIPDYKGLRGDPSDNIPGVKGIGEKTAMTLVGNFGSLENIYEKLEKTSEAELKKLGITPRIAKLILENREDADFSKILATINRDVPIDFYLPEKVFKDGLEKDKVSALWKELEFRTLPQRFEKAVFGGEEVKDILTSPTIEVGRIAKRPPAPSFLGDLSVDGRLEHIKIALWLADSTITNPQNEDIVNFSGMDDMDKAGEIIFSELDKKDLRKIYEDIERPLIPVIKKMEDRGIRVEANVLKELSKNYHTELERLEKAIWDMAGGSFNINSPKQLAEVLFDKLEIKIKNAKKTASGARSTKESELEKMRDLHPIVPLIFEFRELSKLLSTYIDAIPPLLDDESRLHAKFIQTGTTTGRMSSQEPNLQNIPIKSDLGRAIRKAFVASDGFKMVSFDYSQIELRIAAFLSGDQKLIDIFKKGEDVHSSVAAQVFDVPLSEVSPEMRRRAKVINFGIIYGMGVLALKQNLGTDKATAQKFLDQYFATFSGLADYLQATKRQAANTGYTKTFFGRRRYFQGIDSKIPYIKAQAERMAVNAPIQGTEADIIKLAMIKIDEYIAKEELISEVFPLLQVHDELIYEIKSDKAKKVADDIKKIMQSILSLEETKGIELTVEAGIGDNWQELK